MPRPRTISGRPTGTREPDWQPLIALVGLELVVWFMWMSQLELADGAVVNAYKHWSTRRYLHLAADGRAFAYMGSDRYLEVTVEQAVQEAFFEWDEVLPSPEPEDLAALDAVLRRTRSAVASEQR
jgi:hypothetical protein